jgi:hypothetical protein
VAKEFRVTPLFDLPAEIDDLVAFDTGPDGGIYMVSAKKSNAQSEQIFQIRSLVANKIRLDFQIALTDFRPHFIQPLPGNRILLGSV